MYKIQHNQVVKIVPAYVWWSLRGQHSTYIAIYLISAMTQSKPILILWIAGSEINDELTTEKIYNETYLKGESAGSKIFTQSSTSYFCSVIL